MSAVTHTSRPRVTPEVGALGSHDGHEVMAKELGHAVVLCQHTALVQCGLVKQVPAQHSKQARGRFLKRQGELSRCVCARES